MNNNNNCILYNYKKRSNIKLTERKKKRIYKLLLNKFTYLLKNPILFNKFDEFIKEKEYHREEGSIVAGVTIYTYLESYMSFLKHCSKEQIEEGWGTALIGSFVNGCSKEEMLEVFKFFGIKIDFF